MIGRFRPIQHFWQAIRGERSPRQIAWAIALGMLVGLIPKGNLTAWLFGFLLVATRINLGVGLLTVLAVSSVSTLLDPLTHGIGLRILSQSTIQAQFAAWYDAPFVPWLAWNNTVVLGSMALGLALLYPVQHLSEFVVRQFQRRFFTKAAEPIDPNGPAIDQTVAELLHDIAAGKPA